MMETNTECSTPDDCEYAEVTRVHRKVVRSDQKRDGLETDTDEWKEQVWKCLTCGWTPKDKQINEG
jgi:hypothetical protein